MYLIGIDIGGTNLKSGLIKDNEIISKLENPTNSFDIIKQVITTIHEIIDNSGLDITNISGISVGCPGIVVNGVVIESANLQLFDCDLKSILMEEFKVPVMVKNDADMATLAEHKLGAGKDSKNMVLLTVGTGVGGGIIINNQLYEGNGGAGELGHITYVKNGIQCNCGRQGCFEKYVSAIALSNRAKKIMQTKETSIIMHDDQVYASDIVTAYKNGDDCAKQILEEYVEDFSNLVCSLCNVFRPDSIVIGGGITHAPDILRMVENRCKMYNYGYKNSSEVKILPAELGNNAGILGACAIFKSSSFDESNLIN